MAFMEVNAVTPVIIGASSSTILHRRPHMLVRCCDKLGHGGGENSNRKMQPAVPPDTYFFYLSSTQKHTHHWSEEKQSISLLSRNLDLDIT